MKKRGVIFIIISVILVLTPFYFIFGPENCETKGCFETAADECSSTKYDFKEDDQITESAYKINGEEGDNCELLIEIKGVSDKYSQTTRMQFEGKSMTCLIPKEEFSRMTFEEMGANLDFCYGPLKEAMYEAVVKKLSRLYKIQLSKILSTISLLFFPYSPVFNNPLII